MIRNFKVMGLAVVAVLAMSVIAASAAQAASSFDLGEAPAVVTGTQKTQNKFTVGAGIVTKCETAKYDATTEAKNVQELTVTPTYAGCQLAGQLAHIVTTGCTYTFTSTATPLQANVDVVCAAGKTITIQQTATGCIVTVGSQATLGKVTAANVGGTEVEATNNVEKIKYTGNASCPVGVNGTFENGTLTGTERLTAFKDVAGAEGAATSIQAT